MSASARRASQGTAAPWQDNLALDRRTCATGADSRRRGATSVSVRRIVIGKNIPWAGKCGTCGADKALYVRCKPCRSAYLSRWYAANPKQQERTRANKRRAKAADPVKFAEQVHRYKTSERGRFLSVMHMQRRMARLAGATGEWTEDDIWHLRLRQNGLCALCAVKMNMEKYCKARMTVDHIVPLSMGGSNDASNLQLLCLSCNSGKRDRAMSGIAYQYACLGEVA